MSSLSNNNIELNSLYQEVILEHSKRPRFKGRTEQCQFCHEGKNPLCGDNVTIFCEVDSKMTPPRLTLHFEGSGCSISQASASIMCDSIQNKTLTDVKKILQHAENIYTGKEKLEANDLDDDVEALNGVSKFPVRIKCAALPWKTLEYLIQDNFDAQGLPKEGCHKLKSCTQNSTRKLKIISTEN
jgi:nitrogen fixation NifU-like protein